MTDCHNNHINVKNVFATLNFYRTATTACIRFAKFHFHTFKTIYPALVITKDAYRIIQETQFNTLFFCVMNFFLTGRHFIFTTTINNVNMFSAQTFCSTSSIHCYVTCTNDGSLFTAVNRSCNFGELVSFHKVYTSQELICRIYTVKVFAVNIHKVRQASTGTNINCIKAFFFHQFFNGKGTTDYSINNNLNAQIFQRFNFVLYDFFRQTELRNTIHQNATCNVESFVNGYVITKFSQVASSSQTGRATAYDCYFFTFSNDFGSFYLV